MAVGATMVGCTSEHAHDGLYVANISTSGMVNAWILKGDELTTYSLGVINVKSCRQTGDALVVGRDTFRFNQQGDIVIRYDSTRSVDYRMRRVSDQTEYTISELNKLVDEVYDSEGSGGRGKDETTNSNH